MNSFHPEDRPDPSEQPIRARVPEHISGGAFSTGVIVMTAQTEFILDFVQNLGRPHQIVARVVMPHNVLPQLVDALQRNIELYRGRWGELPQVVQAGIVPGQPQRSSSDDSGETHAEELAPPSAEPNSAAGGAPAGGSSQLGNPTGNSTSESSPQSTSSNESASQPADDELREPPLGAGTRQTTAQEVYDDLKIRDEFLSGAYANAVMIGHGPHEFSFDFITNFYPHSAVSSRVFLAAGQVPRLYDSLKGTWEQLRRRLDDRPDGQLPF
ncbi:DUF3467 domain-containing protein [Aureliella helgolandensis]|uniref:DUF3467 domain-containing protein n=1 Tax=Aureliella helgolandensis TaxID=2527968 RepID=A0A518GFX9_9BACT|nr:DUF3467 domain-containing protein [Aureliella helgolandensis]QDV27502.1 hypothetical protein Q31a_58910 [Aureliella helgolandensis]